MGFHALTHLKITGTHKVLQWKKLFAPPKSLLTAWLAGVWIPRAFFLLAGLDRQVQPLAALV